MKDLGKRNVLGVLVDSVDLEAAVDRVMKAARRRQPYGVTALAVHGVMNGARDLGYRRRVNDLGLVVPDGQPVRWALNLLHRTALASSVRGTDLTVRVLGEAEREGLPVFLYGSRRETLERVRAQVVASFPELRVAGIRPSAFEAVDEESQDLIAEEIRDSGAAIVFVGLGCPRQEIFVSAMSERVGTPMLAVGAAFDYLGGTLREPPRLLRRFGLEWAWRLALEPRRLWRRYVLLNPAYLGLLALQAVGLHRPAPLTGASSRIRQLDA